MYENVVLRLQETKHYVQRFTEDDTREVVDTIKAVLGISFGGFLFGVTKLSARQQKGNAQFEAIFCGWLGR